MRPYSYMLDALIPPWFSTARADTLYDELAPMQVLDARPAAEEGCREFLIQWPDGAPDSWVRASNLGRTPSVAKGLMPWQRCWQA